MVFDWEQYLRLAEIITKEETTEAVYRTAISRAYYAAFNFARIYIQGNHSDKIRLSVDDAKVHGDVRRFFRDFGDHESNLIAKKLETLRADRNSADYDDELSGFPKRMSVKATKDAKLVIESINRLKNNSDEGE